MPVHRAPTCDWSNQSPQEGRALDHANPHIDAKTLTRALRPLQQAARSEGEYEARCLLFSP